MFQKLFTLCVFFAFSYGSALSFKDEPLHYHPDMKTMTMMTEDGDVIDVDLTGSTAKEFPGDYVEKHTIFYLYTRDDSSKYRLYKNDSATLQGSTFNVSRPTKLVIHGYFNTYKSQMEQSVKNAYLGAQDVNVICVDWSGMAIPDYAGAVNSLQKVGHEIAQMVDFLVSTGGASVGDFHLIGHSLGAHVSAFAANLVTMGSIPRITGLDPALPLFANRPASNRLDPSDASVVDCIHTCGMYLGWYQPLCTHDFYPNGGVPVQPGCGFDFYGGCSHGRSYELFSSSVSNQFPSQSCVNFTEVMTNNCTGTMTGYMGDAADESAPGIYYLQTSSSTPYIKQ